MSRLRIGLLGCADFALRRAVPSLLKVPELELTAAASRSAGKAEAFAKTFGCAAVTGYDKLLSREDVDAVYVPLPPTMHPEWVGKALEAGKHAFVEKPFAVDLESAQAMVDKARSAKRLLVENFAFRHHARTAGLLKSIQSGEIGSIRLVRAAFGFPPLDPSNIRYDPALGGGALLDAGVYCVQASLALLGPGLKVVGAQLQRGATGVDVRGAAMLASEAGQFAQLAFGFEHSYQSSLSVWGSRGRLTLERAFTARADQETVLRLERQEGGVEERRFPAEDQYATIFGHFARTAMSGEGFETDFARILEQAACVESVMKEAAR